eukprot:SAG25_NODE_2177_length_1866_cov_21.079796_3_plen_182_part_01
MRSGHRKCCIFLLSLACACCRSQPAPPAAWTGASSAQQHASTHLEVGATSACGAVVAARAFYQNSTVLTAHINCSGDIGSEAFRGSALRSVRIGSAVTGIGAHAFRSCNHLHTAVIDSSGAGLSQGWIFAENAALVSVEIGHQVTGQIGTFAFYGCSSLASVTIGSSVSGVHQYAFHQLNMA